MPRLLTTTEPGLEVHGGQEHHDAVDVREEPERHALVGHPVLQAQDRHLAGSHCGELLEGRRRLVRLGGQHHHVVVTPLDVGGIVDGRDVEDHVAVGIAEAEAARRQRVEVRPARHEHHPVPVLMETPTGGPSDGTRTDHDVPHGPSISGRGPDMSSIRPR